MVPDLSTLDVPNLPDYQAPVMDEEPSLVEDERLPQDVIDDDGDVAYDIVQGATKRGRCHLVDSLGYMYTRVKQTDSGKCYICLQFICLK